MKKTVAIIFGGVGFESEISVKSAENIISALDKKLYSPLPIFIAKDGSFRIVEPHLAKNAKKAPEAFPVRLDGESGFLVFGKVIPARVAIIALHGNRGEDGVVQGALINAGIAVLGQSVLASALTNDKASTKAMADKLGIKNAEWLLLTEENENDALILAKEKFNYPLFMKASSFGSSYGAYKIDSDTQFCTMYRKIRDMGEVRILLEEYIAIDYELECAYLDIGKEYYLPHGIVHSQGRLYSLEEKYKGDSSFAPSLGKIPKPLSALAIEYSRSLKRLLGIKYLARFDFFIRENELIFNEINCFPGMTATSLYPKMISEGVLPFCECLTRLIQYAEKNDRDI